MPILLVYAYLLLGPPRLYCGKNVEEGLWGGGEEKVEEGRRGLLKNFAPLLRASSPTYSADASAQGREERGAKYLGRRRKSCRRVQVPTFGKKMRRGERTEISKLSPSHRIRDSIAGVDFMTLEKGERQRFSPFLGTVGGRSFQGKKSPIKGKVKVGNCSSVVGWGRGGKNGPRRGDVLREIFPVVVEGGGGRGG